MLRMLVAASFALGMLKIGGIITLSWGMVFAPIFAGILLIIVIPLVAVILAFLMS